MGCTFLPLDTTQIFSNMCLLVIMFLKCFIRYNNVAHVSVFPIIGMIVLGGFYFHFKSAWWVRNYTGSWGRKVAKSHSSLKFMADRKRKEGMVRNWVEAGERVLGEGGRDRDKHNLTADILVLFLLKSFHPLFQDVSWFMGMGRRLQRRLLALGTPGQLLPVFWSVMTFCVGLLCKTKIFSRRGRTALIFGVRNPYLERSCKSHWFGKMRVEGSSCWMFLSSVW